MDAATIFNILSNDEYACPMFLGVYAPDVLFYLNPTFPSAFVINTTTSDYVKTGLQLTTTEEELLSFLTLWRRQLYTEISRFF